MATGQNKTLMRYIVEPGKRIILAVISCLVIAAGCSSEPADPTPPTATPSTTAQNKAEQQAAPQPIWATTHHISLPEVSGHTEVALPLQNEDGSWKKPTVFISQKAISLNDVQLGDIQCDQESCELTDSSISPLLKSQVGKKEAVVLVTDKSVTASVLIPILRATATKKRPAVYLTQGKDGLAQGVVVEPGAPPLRPGIPPEIRDALEGGPGADRYLSDRKTLRRGDPVAPGVQVRVTGGKLVVPEKCGGSGTATKVRRNMRAYNACYRLARQRNEATAGTLQLAWNLTQDGKASDIKSTSRDFKDPELHACIEEAIVALPFPAHSAPVEECRVSWQIKMQPRDPNVAKETRKERQLRLKILVQKEGFQLEPSGSDTSVHVAADDWDALQAKLTEWSATHKQLLVRAQPHIRSDQLARIASMAKSAGFGRIFLAETR